MSNKSTLVRNVAHAQSAGSFGDRLRELIGAQSTRQWAIETGLVPRTVSDCLKSGRPPHDSSLRPIADRYGTGTVRWLREGGVPSHGLAVREDASATYGDTLVEDAVELVESTLQSRGLDASPAHKGEIVGLIVKIVREQRDRSLPPEEVRIIKRYLALLLRRSERE